MQTWKLYFHHYWFLCIFDWTVEIDHFLAFFDLIGGLMFVELDLLVDVERWICLVYPTFTIPSTSCQHFLIQRPFNLFNIVPLIITLPNNQHNHHYNHKIHPSWPMNILRNKPIFKLHRNQPNKNQRYNKYKYDINHNNPHNPPK